MLCFQPSLAKTPPVHMFFPPFLSAFRFWVFASLHLDFVEQILFVGYNANEGGEFMLDVCGDNGEPLLPIGVILMGDKHIFISGIRRFQFRVLYSMSFVSILTLLLSRGTILNASVFGFIPYVVNLWYSRT
jgi:hypothetical protein